MSVPSLAWAICRHDLARELRRPVNLGAVLTFGVASLVVLRIALSGAGQPTPAVLAGALWILLLYGALLGTGRAFAAEREDGTWDALLLVGVDRSAVLGGKLLGSLALVVAVQVAVVPLFLAMFGGPPTLRGLGLLLATIALADVGLAAVGVLVAALGLRARGRELVGPAMYLPMTMPLVIVAVTATLGAWGVEDGARMPFLLGFLAAYDAIFVLVGIAALPDLAVE